MGSLLIKRLRIPKCILVDVEQNGVEPVLACEQFRAEPGWSAADDSHVYHVCHEPSEARQGLVRAVFRTDDTIATVDSIWTTDSIATVERPGGDRLDAGD